MTGLRERLKAAAAAENFSAVGRIYFDDDDTPSEPVDELRMPGGEAMEAIGGDSSGGVYFLVGEGGDSRRVLYVDSEGSAGLVADNLAEGIELILGLPNWDDFTVGERRGWDAEQVSRWHEDQGSTETGWVPAAARMAAVLGLRIPPAVELIARLDRAAASTTADWLPITSLHRPTRDDRTRHEDVQYESIFRW